MFAVIETGGKQYKVAKNDVLKVEKLGGEAGSIVEFDHVVLLGDEAGKVTLGSPYVAKALVFAEIIKQAKDEKIIIFKKRRRHNYRRKNGHRQQLTWLKVQDISADGVKKIAAPKQEAKKPDAAKKTTKKSKE